MSCCLLSRTLSYNNILQLLCTPSYNRGEQSECTPSYNRGNITSVLLVITGIVILLVITGLKLDQANCLTLVKKYEIVPGKFGGKTEPSKMVMSMSKSMTEELLKAIKYKTYDSCVSSLTKTHCVNLKKFRRERLPKGM